jgi:NAD(P)-dependent dehydrogenase (short-subunit alcohol dehydrogenase family)
MDLGLRGKVAIVAACSRGMGRATAMGLAAEGARVHGLRGAALVLSLPCARLS